MAQSYSRYFSDGVTVSYPIAFPYLNRNSIQMFVNGVSVPFTWDSSQYVRLTTPAPPSAVIEVRRSTPSDTRLVDFVDGSTLTEADLDRANDHVRFVAQEAKDRSNDAIVQNFDGSWDFRGQPARNVSDPINPQDAVNRQWVETAVTSSVVQARESALTALSTLDQITTISTSFTPRTATVTALKAITPSTLIRSALLTEAGREGTFIWVEGDYSFWVAQDTRNGVFVKANTIPSTTGAWVRQGGWRTEGLQLTWFGLTFVDDTATLNTALNLAFQLGVRIVLYGAQNLTVSGFITIPDNTALVGNGTGVITQKAGVNLSAVFNLGNGASLRGCVVDGNWANNTVTGSFVLVRIGDSNDCTVEGNVLRNYGGFPIVVNGGLRAIIRKNKVSNFYQNGIQVFGSDTQADHLIEDNDVFQIGWSGINVANANGCVVRANRVTGYLLGGRGGRLVANLSGTTVTWVSGPKFTDVRKGSFVTCNNGLEFRIASVVSATQLTVEGILPTLSGVQIGVGAGDLLGIVQGSYNKFYDNILKDTTTFCFGFSLGQSQAPCLGNEFYNNTLINAGKNAVNITGIHFGGGGWLENNSVKGNKIVNAGCGGGIGPEDRVAIYLSNGPNVGAILSTHIANNTIQSSVGDGQTHYWLGTDKLLNLGSVTVSGNAADGTFYSDILNGVKAIQLSAAWGSTATATDIFTDGATVQFTLTASGTGLASGGSFTILKIVEASAGLPTPTAKTVSGTAYLPVFWGENLSSKGTWYALQRDATVPVTGTSFLIRMSD